MEASVGAIIIMRGIILDHIQESDSHFFFLSLISGGMKEFSFLSDEICLFTVGQIYSFQHTSLCEQQDYLTSMQAGKSLCTMDKARHS